MKLIVPLQGIVQGRGGLLLGSLIPCGLFYFLQLYLKRYRSNNTNNNNSSNSPPDLPRSSSRTNLSSTRGSISLSFLANSLAKPDSSPFYIGLQRVSLDPYHPLDNPQGIIQLGFADNMLCLDLIEKWMSANVRESLIGTDDVSLSIHGITMYQPFDGLEEVKRVK